MNRKRYLELVKKLLLCSNKEKRLICKELQSDIEAAIETGESWISIQERLGTPEELANEFNENLEVKKKVDNKWLWLATIVLVCGVIVLCVNVWMNNTSSTDPTVTEPKTREIQDSKVFKQETLNIYGREIVDLLSQKKYEEVQSYFYTDLKIALNSKTLEMATEKLGDLGKYQKITNQQYIEVIDKRKTMAVGEIVALYEKRSVTYTITFNSDMLVVGLYMR